MATYVLPQVLVFQEFTAAPAAALHPLRAHVSGGHAKLVRFGEADERDDGLLGFYDPLLETSYAWPHRPAGATIDAAYTRLWLRDALLRYFETFAGGGDGVTKLAGFNNRVTSAALSFAANGADFPRSADFLDRDVAPGDVVKVRGLNGDSEPVTLWTYVKRLVANVVDPEVGAATGDVNNETSQGASSSVAKVAGVLNGVVLAADESGYDGLATGHTDETYDLLVTEPSVDGDFTVARLRVISGSGTDDQVDVQPGARGEPFDVGTRGLACTFNDDDLSSSSLSAEDAGIPVDELVVGHRWRVTVHQAFTAPVATSAGTYTGAADTTYVVEVSRGGTYAGAVKPQIAVTTTDGSDISGPTTVSAANTSVAAGTRGTLIKFSGTALRKGDKYYVPVLAAAGGAYQTIELGANLDTDIDAGSELDLTLFIRKPELEVTANRLGFAPQTNWTQSDTEVTVSEGMIAYDSSWTDGGVPQPLDVLSAEGQDYGALYVEYRAWLADLCQVIDGVADTGTLDEVIPGPLHPDNPLKWGVFKALQNSNGTEVKFSSVCDPDSDESWTDVLELLVGRGDVYGLVPLTRRRTVLDLFQAHAAAQSGAEQANWRVCWFNLAGVPKVPVVHAGSDVANHAAATTADGEVALAVVEDDPATSGTQYTVVRVTSGNSLFLTNGVRPGDVVRTNYTGDGFGNFTYTEFVVDEVQAEDQLRLLVGPAGPVTVGAKIEVWRNLSAAEEAAEIAATAGSWGDRRVRAVWPDSIESSGTVMEGYHLCASLAGLTSGVLPHQGLTRLEVSGYSNVNRTTGKFNRSQLDAMAGGGVWVVTQDPVSGAIYTRHAVTAADYDDINAREEMIVRNVDSISYRFKEHFAPFIGVTNVTPVILTRIATEFENIKNVLKTELATDNLGGQLIDAAVVELRRHVTLRDRIVLKVNLTVPYSLNVLEIHLAI